MSKASEQSHSSYSSNRPATLDGMELMNDVLSSLESLIEESRFKIVVGSIPEVYGVKANIEQVLKHILTNAIKYSRNSQRSHLEIFAQEDNDKVTLAVRDFGPGISRKDQERIFTLFERIDTSVQGRGLGLAISKTLVTEWGGKIWVDSEVNYGSTFYFTIPNRPLRKISTVSDVMMDGEFFPVMA